MGAQADRSPRCWKKDLLKMCNKIRNYRVWTLFSSCFFCISLFPLHPLLPFFFSSLFFLWKSGSDAGYWAFENLILDLPWDSDLVILRPGFPAENGDNNAFFIWLPASFVSLDTEALGRQITFCNIQVFQPNLWGRIERKRNFRH